MALRAKRRLRQHVRRSKVTALRRRMPSLPPTEEHRASFERFCDGVSSDVSDEEKLLRALHASEEAENLLPYLAPMRGAADSLFYHDLLPFSMGAQRQNAQQ